VKHPVTTATYHLWFKPAGRAYETLAQTIRTLAGQLDTPVFEPHVTLLAYLNGGETEHFQRAGELATRLKPCEVILTEPSFQNDYFQCLYMLVHPTPDVMTNRVMAEELFDRAQEPYMPHLSLVYGSLPESRKRAIIRRLPPDIRTSFVATTLYLIRADSMAPKDWREIAAFQFGGGGGGTDSPQSEPDPYHRPRNGSEGPA
jgi:2'-5' RNA ligase